MNGFLEARNSEAGVHRKLILWSLRGKLNSVLNNGALRLLAAS